MQKYKNSIKTPSLVILFNVYINYSLILSNTNFILGSDVLVYGEVREIPIQQSPVKRMVKAQ